MRVCGMYMRGYVVGNGRMSASEGQSGLESE